MMSAVHPPRPARRRSAWLVVATTLGVLAACSAGSDRAERPATTAATTAAVTTTVTFQPRVAATPIEYPAQPPGVAWPTEEWPTGPLPAGVRRADVDAVVDRAFGELSADPHATTDAVLVVQGGRIVAERYRPGFGDRTTVHRSWSMAKSFTQALVGILVREGRLDIYAPAPVPEWSSPDDPRHAITTDQLLRMASGLQWTESYSGTGDVITLLFGAGKHDMAHYAASKPLAAPPDTKVAYSTGTSNIVAGIVGGVVGRGEPYHRFVDDELLRPIGIDPARTALGWDGVGNLVGGSIFDLTARDFARFGLLYLRGGSWDGRQIVPQGWVDYGRTPTPPPHGQPTYGAHWWTYEDCPGGFRAGGFNGQHIVLCPSLDLIVVVLSNRGDGKDGQVRDDLVHVFRDEMR
jgi:CubicO group peptidase (beta-lactamase class C family)